jgi:sigma-54 specific flagellar transcriptional regulator A
MPDIVSEPTDLQAFFTANPDFSFRDHMTRMEIAFIKGALAQSQGSVSAAARLLGLQRTTLIEKMRKYGLQREEV